MLDDYAFLIHACLDGWLATGEAKYYRAALGLAKRMVAEFYDTAGGGFFDATAKGRNAAGRIDGAAQAAAGFAHSGGKPGCSRALLRLEALNGSADLREKAEDTLEAFAGVVEHFGLYAGTYGLALERLLLPPVQVVVIGEDAAAERWTRQPRHALCGEQKRHPFDPGAGRGKSCRQCSRKRCPCFRISRRRTASPWCAGEPPAFPRPQPGAAARLVAGLGPCFPGKRIGLVGLGHGGVGGSCRFCLTRR